MSYEEETAALLRNSIIEREKIWEKYKDQPGKDGPGTVEERKESERFQAVLKELKKKYGR